MKKLLLPVLLIALSLMGCVNNATEDTDPRPKTLPRALTASEEALIDSGNGFSMRIFRETVAADDNKNVFMSPLSVSMALGMTLNGAAGETATAMKETLGMSGMELQEINKSYKSLIELLVELDPGVTVNIANSVWNDEQFSVKQSFNDTLETYFNARAGALDFSDPSSVDVINSWVSDQTNGNIETLIEEIPAEVVMYLVNAVYFKGDWLQQFDAEQTQPMAFKLEDGTEKQVDMMYQEAPIATYRSDEVMMGELAYGDSLYKMTVLMPADAGIAIDDFIGETFTGPSLRDWTNRLQSRETQVYLPKFEVSYKKPLNDILKSMGMGIAFDKQEADFSGINEDRQLFISNVMHKADITVNEEGSEASAATSVGVGVTSGPPVFKVDRPFVYLIRERISGTILFAGKMQNPAQ